MNKAKAEAAIKLGPSSAEPSGEQLEEGDEMLVKAKFVKDYGNLAGVCYALVQCAGDTEPYVAAYEDIFPTSALSTAPQAEPSEVTEATVKAARVYVVELEDAFDRIDGNVDAVLRKMLRAALKAGSL